MFSNLKQLMASEKRINNLNIARKASQLKKTKPSRFATTSSVGNKLDIRGINHICVLQKKIRNFKKFTQLKDNIVIMIDPGHGGDDIGVSGILVKEKDITLQVALILKKMLEQYEFFTILLTRDSDVNVAEASRINYVLDTYPDIMISLHAGKYHHLDHSGSVVCVANSREEKCITNWSCSDKFSCSSNIVINDATVNLNKYLGKCIMDSLSNFDHLHLPSLEFVEFDIIKYEFIPSVLIELSAVGNEHNEKMLSGYLFLKNLSIAIYNGVIEYLDNYVASILVTK